MQWNFKEEKQEFALIPEGEHRIRVSSVEERKSQSGRDMLCIVFEVSGIGRWLFHNIVFLEDRPEITNRNLTNFFESFRDIKMGDTNTANWIGKVGACKIKHNKYDGKTSEKVYYFIRADKQDNLPAWKEPPKAPSTSVNADSGFVALGADEVLPF